MATNDVVSAMIATRGLGPNLHLSPHDHTYKTYIKYSADASQDINSATAMAGLPLLASQVSLFPPPMLQWCSSWLALASVG